MSSRRTSVSLRRCTGSFAIATCVAIAGCATTSAGTSSSDDPDDDPWEPFNRKVFDFNQVLDRNVVKPVAKAYRSALPEYVRDRIRSFIDNVHEPLVFANDVLQARGAAALTTGTRFVVNSTVGILGFWDRAAEWGWMRQSGDFGQTLYTWGVTEGPYLVLPLFGPSNVRDAVGLGVDSYASPLGFIGSDGLQREVAISLGVTDGVDLRSRHIESLEQLEAGSLDFYAFLRSVSQQARRATLKSAAGRDVDDELADPGASTRDEAKPAPRIGETPADRPASTPDAKP